MPNASEIILHFHSKTFLYYSWGFKQLTCHKLLIFSNVNDTSYPEGQCFNMPVYLYRVYCAIVSPFFSTVRKKVLKVSIL